MVKKNSRRTTAQSKPKPCEPLPAGASPLQGALTPPALAPRSQPARPRAQVQPREQPIRCPRRAAAARERPPTSPLWRRTAPARPSASSASRSRRPSCVPRSAGLGPFLDQWRQYSHSCSRSRCDRRRPPCHREPRPPREGPRRTGLRDPLASRQARALARPPRAHRAPRRLRLALPHGDQGQGVRRRAARVGRREGRVAREGQVEGRCGGRRVGGAAAGRAVGGQGLEV